MLPIYILYNTHLSTCAFTVLFYVSETQDVKGIIPIKPTNKYWTISCSVCSHVHRLCNLIL